MADLPAAPNRFRAGMLRYRNLLPIPEARSYYLLDVNDMEQIQEFVEALREIGFFKKSNSKSIMQYSGVWNRYARMRGFTGCAKLYV